jgi:flavin-dependent dehydrogenase
VTGTDCCDVVVIGAGPAGSTAAQLLASWGWRTVLVHRGSSRRSLAESLPSSTRKLLAFLGQLTRVEAAGFHPNHGNVARWAERSRVTPTAEAGFHVSRAAFDGVLRDAATAAGARRIDAVVRRVDAGDPVRVAYAAADRRGTLSAHMVLDCSGRAGVVARRGWRRTDARYRTLALAAEWDCGAWPEGERTQTLVESFEDGWAWSVPLSATRRQCTVMIDPKALGGARGERPSGSQLSAAYESGVEKTTQLRARLTAARPIGTAWACDASVYTCARAADGGVLLVGDAASFIEPLSSAGVKKALLSGWRAAVVANTCLADRSRADAARDLFNARERQVYADCTRRSAAFFDEAAGAYRSPFWSARADHASSTSDSMARLGDVDDEAIALNTDVRRAFDDLRATARVRLRASSSLRVEPIAAIEGREVVLRDALVVPGVAAPLRFAAGVDLPALARLARGAEDVSALIAAYHEQVGPVPVSGLLTGLSLLVAHQALVIERF